MYLRCQFVAFWTVFRREVARFLRIWIQTLLPTPVTMALYFVIFGQVIGRKIGPIEGISYLTYLTPGLVMLGMINNAFGNVVSSFFGSKFQRHIEEMLVSPMDPWVIVLGYVLGGVFRALIIGIVTILIAESLTDLWVVSWSYTLALAFLTCLTFALAGFTNALFAKKFDDISVIPTFVITPMTYCGGVFYSIEGLPHWLATVTHFNPIFYIVGSFRSAFLGVGDVAPEIGLIVLALTSILLFMMNIICLKKRVGL